MTVFKTPKPIHINNPVNSAMTIQSPTWVRGAFSYPTDLGNVLSYESQLDGRVIFGITNFRNKLFIAHGNYNINTGPTDIVYYDLATEQVVRPMTCQTEDLEFFKEINGRLWTPGGDSKLDWSVGADCFVSADGINWETRRIPLSVHHWDIWLFKGKLYICNGTQTVNDCQDEVMSSPDDGLNWSAEIPVGTTAHFYNDWAMCLFELNDFLYCLGCISAYTDGHANNAYNIVWKSDGQNKEVITFNYKQLFPGIDDAGRFFRVKKACNFKGKTLMLLGADSYGPNFLYEISSLIASRRIVLPFETHGNVGRETVWQLQPDPFISDYLIRGDTVYVLAVVQYSTKWFMNIVAKSKDLQNWEEVFRFQTTNGCYAFSFEEVNGTFYIGYGSSIMYSGGLQTGNGTMIKVIT